MGPIAGTRRLARLFLFLGRVSGRRAFSSEHDTISLNKALIDRTTPHTAWTLPIDILTN